MFLAALVIFFVAIPVAVGVYAQRRMGRTGVIWALISAGLTVAVTALFEYAITHSAEYIIDYEHRIRMQSDAAQIGRILFAAIVANGFAGTVLATLPKPSRAEPSPSANQVAEERKCPFCAEMIKREAIVCKYCGRDVPRDETAGARAAELESEYGQLTPEERAHVETTRGIRRSYSRRHYSF